MIRKRNAYLICLLPFVFLAFLLGMSINESALSLDKEDSSGVNNAIEEVTAKEEESEPITLNDVTEEEPAREAETEEQPEVIELIDFEALQAANPDILAWVTIPGTDVDYPVAQHPRDDEYYLKHGPDGMYSSDGCPYIELCDSGSFREFNTVIYGHNMNDGSMFGALHKFEDKDYFSEHRDLIINTTEHVFTYRIFAAVMFDDRRIPYYFDDALESDRVAFLQALKSDIVSERSVVSDDINVSEDNCIVTLSTCDRKLRNNRFLVVAALTKIDGQDVG